MLNLYKAGQENEENKEIDRKINEIINDEKYSRLKIPQFPQKPKFEKLSKVAKFFERVIKFFDVFGARPQLIAPPHSSSIFSCLLTLIILACAILTFALTLKNMGVVRTYWDEIFVPPEHQSLNMTTGSELRTVMCFPEPAFTNNFVISNDRVINVQFYQYKRNKTQEEYTYYDTIPMQYENNPYFDKSDVYYQDINLTFCMRPDNDIVAEVYGDAHSNEEAHVGFRVTPNCFGTPAYCASNANTINRRFYAFLNTFTISTFFSDAKYHPDVQNILYAPAATILSDLSSATNFTRSVDQAVIMNTLQLVDNSAAWIMGEYPKPYKQVLTASSETSYIRQKSVDTTVPQYQIKFLISGRVIRVIF